MQKHDYGREFVSCRLAARDFKPRREGPRDVLFVARGPGRSETHVHLNAKGDEEEWVELPDVFKKFGMHAKLKRWLHAWNEKSSVRMVGRLRQETGE